MANSTRRRRRKKLQRLTPALPRQIDGSRGTKLYAFNYFRSPMLTALLDDLNLAEDSGIELSLCNAVHQLLNHFTNYATEFPRGGFLTGPIYKEFRGFSEMYTKWNGFNGTTPYDRQQRHDHYKHLQDLRQKITNKSRQLQFELDKELDMELLKASYKSVSDIITLGPEVFKNLSSAFSQYIKRAGPLA